MKSASEILLSHGIRVRSLREGNQKTRCPKCSHLRKHKSDPCLSVSIDTKGVRFLCHNCSFHGGEFYESEDRRPSPQTRHKPAGGGYAGMQHRAAAAWR